ncbi:hypothetical protein CYY_003973 [Polysphondylium violaceum]|uniref:non-specific serine/threonine protein kinase n=1 Tax=Polysphondylium violaceum TaxID=133409 RepID=A0A8J4Q672_9MYCE|nr:hypothetical protein CYY_003973 [Polysphondylium violaceum]
MDPAINRIIKKIKFNKKDLNGNTPLHLASLDYDEMVLGLFLNTKGICSYVNMENQDHNTPFHYFCEKSKPKSNIENLFKLYIQNNVKINSQNKFGETPLHKALLNTSNTAGNLVLHLLIQSGANVNLSNNKGETVLHYAIRLKKDKNVILEIIKAGIELDTIDSLCDLVEDKGPGDEVFKIFETFKWLKSLNLEDYFTQFLMADKRGPSIYFPKHVLEKFGISNANIQKINESCQEYRHRVQFIVPKKLLKSNLDKMVINEGEIEKISKIGFKRFKGKYNGNIVEIKKFEEITYHSDEYEKELLIMSSINSPYVVKFYGVSLDVDMKLVMEYCEKNNLYHVLENEPHQINWDRFFSFASQITKGIEYLQNMKPQIVCRRFKSLNILVTDQWECKISDYGFNNFDLSRPDKYGLLGDSFSHLSPEQFDRHPYSNKMDTYSFGIILWELLTTVLLGEYKIPYFEFTKNGTQFAEVYGIIIKIVKNDLRPKLPESCPIELNNLYKQCISKDPHKRPTCQDILSSLSQIECQYQQNPKLFNDLCIKKYKI